MEENEGIYCAQSVARRIPGHVRVIQWMLYFFVLLFTIAGALWGFFWLFPALGTLVGSWYYMGVARVTYAYRLEGTRLTVERTSGLRSRPKTVPFGDFDLGELILVGPEGAPQLGPAEADSLASPAKRIVYDVSAHDPDRICSVMYLTAAATKEGRPLKVVFQPDGPMLDCLRRIAPDRVVGYPEP